MLLRKKCPYFSGLYFPEFGLNMKKYSVSFRIQSECGKIVIGTRKTPNPNTFHAVYYLIFLMPNYMHRVYSQIYNIIEANLGPRQTSLIELLVKRLTPGNSK